MKKKVARYSPVITVIGLTLNSTNRSFSTYLNLIYIDFSLQIYFVSL